MSYDRAKAVMNLMKNRLDVSDRKFLFSQMQNYISVDKLDDFRLRSGSGIFIPAKNNFLKEKNLVRKEVQEIFKLEKTVSGWQTKPSNVLSFLIEESKFLGQNLPELVGKVANDGTNLREGIVVSGYTPLNIKYYGTQNVDSCFPLAIFEGKENTLNLTQNLDKTTEQIKILDGSKFQDTKISFKMINDVKCSKLICMDFMLNSKQICLKCKIPRDLKTVFFTNNSKILKEEKERMETEQSMFTQVKSWSERPMRTELNNIFGISIDNISFCGLHCLQRITEFLVVMATFCEENKENLCNLWLKKMKIHAKITDIKIDAENFEKGKLTMLKGDECKRILKNYFSFLQFLEVQDAKVYLVFSLWNIIVFNILEATTEDVKKLNKENSQHVLDSFFAIIVLHFNKLGIPDYLHYVQCHLLDEIELHGSMLLINNQGFENNHQKDEKTYNNTRKGGAGSDFIYDMMEITYMKNFMRYQIAKKLADQVQKKLIPLENLSKASRILGPMPKAQQEKEKCYRYYFLLKYGSQSFFENEWREEQEEEEESLQNIVKNTEENTEEIRNLLDKFLSAETTENNCLKSYFYNDLRPMLSLIFFSNYFFDPTHCCVQKRLKFTMKKYFRSVNSPTQAQKLIWDPLFPSKTSEALSSANLNIPSRSQPYGHFKVLEKNSGWQKNV